MSELVEFLREMGATDEDLEEHAHDLPGLASVLLLRPGTERLTLRQLAERTGMSLGDITHLWLVTGFAEPDPDARVASDADIAVYQTVKAAQELFGEEAIVQLSRVLGSSLARIADAIVSMFLVNLELPLHSGSDVAMEVARANKNAASLIPALTDTIDVVLRNHLLAARRSLLAVQIEGGRETQRLAVGFVDLVGSTALAQQQSLAEWGAVLSEFEHLAQDAVTARGARLVKLIGDEVMYATPDANAALAVATELTSALRSHPQVPPVRAGLAFGDVMTRDGDCFGPVVNVAARAVKLAEPSQVVVSTALRDALADASRLQSIGQRSVKGIDEPLELWALAD